MWSPCTAPAGELKLGPFVVAAVRDCPIAGQNLPLVVVSHGYGGTYLSHQDTAQTLADAGFVVVAVNHPGDMATNEAKAGDFSALISRPSDIKRLIDFMLGPSPDSARIDARRIGFFGFSRGGYTGLVLGGATPDFRELRRPCQDPTGATCERVDSEGLLTEKLPHDPRIRAIVAADPLSTVFPTKDSVKAVAVPVQLWASQHGGDGVSPESVPVVARNLPVKPDLHVVPDAGHFAFLTPCPAELAKSLPELCTDGPGFDRVAFHKELNQTVLAFFRKHLGEAAGP